VHSRLHQAPKTCTHNAFIQLHARSSAHAGITKEPVHTFAIRLIGRERFFLWLLVIYEKDVPWNRPTCTSRLHVLPAGERPVSEQASLELGNNKAARSIFDKFDLNGDGLLSFGEFMLVLTLLSIPEEDVAVIFR